MFGIKFEFVRKRFIKYLLLFKPAIFLCLCSQLSNSNFLTHKLRIGYISYWWRRSIYPSSDNVSVIIIFIFNSRSVFYQIKSVLKRAVIYQHHVIELNLNLNQTPHPLNCLYVFIYGAVSMSVPCPGPMISFPSCPSLAFSFFPNSRPMEDLMPFFFGCLWRESWLLATLLRALASVSNVAVSLETVNHINSVKVELCLYTARV